MYRWNKMSDSFSKQQQNTRQCILLNDKESWRDIVKMFSAQETHNRGNFQAAQNTHDFMDIVVSVAKLEFSRSVAVCIDPPTTTNATQSRALRALLFQLFNNKYCGGATHVAVSRWCRILKWSALVMVLVVCCYLAEVGITKAKSPDSLPE